MAEAVNPNMRYFKPLARTDPKFTKDFTRAGGFKGTAINPMWCIMRMTETFGPCGDGWGVEAEPPQVIDQFERAGTVLVFSRARVWWRDSNNCQNFTPWCWGGDELVTTQKSGRVVSDDESFKKAQTDAMMKCFTYLGLAADVHLGLYDDSKYVARIAHDIDEEKKERKARPRPADTQPAPPPAAQQEPEPAAQQEPGPEPTPAAPAPETAAPAGWDEGVVTTQPLGRIASLLANGAITEQQSNQAKALIENMAFNAHDAGYKDEKVEEWLLKVIDPLLTASKTYAEWLKGAASAADSMADVAAKTKQGGKR